MAKFTVNIQELISQNFIVEAESLQDAIDIATQEYCEGKLVLDQPDVDDGPFIEVYDDYSQMWFNNESLSSEIR